MANEKRLIDANALLDEIAGIYQRHYINSSYQFIHDFFRAVFRRIHKSATVDAVEVVRCKDCKWWQDFSCTNSGGVNGLVVNKDWFCRAGERRERENDSKRVEKQA